jgi:predicted GNAT family N-acyltransferase
MNAIVTKPRAVEAAPEPLIDVTIEVARSLDDLLRVMSVRTLAFMGDQSCPYDEEFDHNDFAGATHLLLKVRGEPAGVARMRWFGEFAKLERVAVVRRFRGGKASIALIEAAVKLAQRKGYRTLLAYAQPRMMPLWQAAFDVRPAGRRDGFVFSDHEYCELVVDLKPVEGALRVDDDPLVLNRPEGAWDIPGVLDQSAVRGATNPMA